MWPVSTGPPILPPVPCSEHLGQPCWEPPTCRGWCPPGSRLLNPSSHRHHREDFRGEAGAVRRLRGQPEREDAPRPPAAAAEDQQRRPREVPAAQRAEVEPGPGCPCGSSCCPVPLGVCLLGPGKEGLPCGWGTGGWAADRRGVPPFEGPLESLKHVSEINGSVTSSLFYDNQERSSLAWDSKPCCSFPAPSVLPFGWGSGARGSGGGAVVGQTPSWDAVAPAQA